MKIVHLLAVTLLVVGVIGVGPGSPRVVVSHLDLRIAHPVPLVVIEMVAKTTDDKIHPGGFQILAQVSNQGLHTLLIGRREAGLAISFSLHPQEGDAIRLAFRNARLRLLEHHIVEFGRIVELLGELVLPGDLIPGFHPLANGLASPRELDVLDVRPGQEFLQLGENGRLLLEALHVALAREDEEMAFPGLGRGTEKGRRRDCEKGGQFHSLLVRGSPLPCQCESSGYTEPGACSGISTSLELLTMHARLPFLTVAFTITATLSLSAAEAPRDKIDLLADPSFKNWVFHLSEKNSLSTRREDVAVIKKGILQVTGKGFGYFRTREAYRNYHLVLEYKWGEKTWSKRSDRARDCGLLLHSHGPDGAFGGAWISCIQAQMLEGSMGDINVLQGKTKEGKLIPTRLTCEVEKTPKGPRWKKGGTPLTFPPTGKSAASIRWKDRDPDWKDVKGFRGSKDVDNPVGEWNRMEVICDGTSYRILLNGILVNEGRDASPAAGFIGIQNEWAECFIRRLELWPVGGFTEKPAKAPITPGPGS